MLKGRGYDVNDSKCKDCPGMVKLYETKNPCVCEWYSSKTGCTDCELNKQEMERFNANCCECYNCIGPV